MAKLTETQDGITLILIAIVALYTVSTMSFAVSLGFVGASLVGYHITKSKLVALLILVIPSLLVKENVDGFDTVTGTTNETGEMVAKRIEEVRQKTTPSVQPRARDAVGVLATSENFQTIAESEGKETELSGYSQVSVPAFIKEKGRLLVVPEMSMPRVGTEDKMPRENRHVGEPDMDGVDVALTPEGTGLPPADVKAVSSA
uniref:Uncharacterized protein n=1 Tax=viral metagenome TaxID=1070528 RepID=A0A6C0BKP9_9ZZZZ